MSVENDENFDLRITDEQMALIRDELRPPHINKLVDEIREHGCVEIEIDPDLDLVIQD